jgi:hypothetical protein
MERLNRIALFQTEWGPLSPAKVAALGDMESPPQPMHEAERGPLLRDALK